MSKVLITGNKGFVGRHFHKYFSNRSQYEILGVDLKSGSDCREFFRRDNTHFDLVIHLAAIVGGRETIERDPLAVATDLSIDADMFNWAIRTKPTKIVYFSSSAAYPLDLQTFMRPLHEEDIDLDEVSNPDMTYGWAKLTGELLAKHAREQYGLDVLVLRPFSGYGNDQDLSYPFPSFIQRAKQRKDPFEIWGNGRQVRDFIHISDIVEATMLAVNENIQGSINLGSGIPTTFNDLAQMICKEARYIPNFTHKQDKPTGVQFRFSDNTQMLSFYTPNISLEHGIWKAFNE